MEGLLDVKKALEELGGVYLDRGCLFVSTTGRLLTGYVTCEVLFPYSPLVQEATAQLIAPFLEEAEGFVCPATGDIVLLCEATRRANDQHHHTTAVWADKQPDGGYRIERSGYAKAIAGKKVVVLNDRISQGRTTRKVIGEARRHGCEVIGVATLVGASAMTTRALNVPRLHQVCTVDVQDYAPEELPAGLQNQPIVVDPTLGHGLEFQQRHPDYPGGFITLLG